MVSQMPAPRAPVPEPKPAAVFGTSAASSGEARCQTMIKSDPPGASVALNGVPVGITPVSVSLQCGVRIDVALEYPGYETIRQPIRVNSNNAELALSMKALSP